MKYSMLNVYLHTRCTQEIDKRNRVVRHVVRHTYFYETFIYALQQIIWPRSLTE